DDRSDWVEIVRRSLKEKVGTFLPLVTRSRNEAFVTALINKPDVLILDMHLTGTEEYDGMHIANSLFAEGFAGKILIASASSMYELVRIAKMINGPVQIPGKDIGRIMECLGLE